MTNEMSSKAFLAILSVILGVDVYLFGRGTGLLKEELLAEMASPETLATLLKVCNAAWQSCHSGKADFHPAEISHRNPALGALVAPTGDDIQRRMRLADWRGVVFKATRLTSRNAA
jgi:hypothetical protein